jgi:hypothetical protein
MLYVLHTSHNLCAFETLYFFSIAGAETTSGVMAWWMLAMVVYPESQKRAQAELDAVVGRDRIPTFADYENLPYIRAMVSLMCTPYSFIRLTHNSDERSIEMASCGMLISLHRTFHEAYPSQGPVGLPHRSIEVCRKGLRLKAVTDHIY